MATLDDEALAELAAIIARMNRRTAPPLQVLGQIMNLLGKKTGGHRCICTMASLYRLSCKLDAEQESEWNCDLAHERDSAQRGRGALQAAEERLIEQELLRARGKAVVMILWDLAKFSDSLDIKWLYQQLKKQGYPAWKTAITLMVHSAPRRMKVAGAVGAVIPRCGRSIVAGCLRSLSCAGPTSHHPSKG